jgi:hypothetical protein
MDTRVRTWNTGGFKGKQQSGQSSKVVLALGEKKKLHLALPLWMRGLGDEGGVRFFS